MGTHQISLSEPNRKPYPSESSVGLKIAAEDCCPTQHSDVRIDRAPNVAKPHTFVDPPRMR